VHMCDVVISASDSYKFFMHAMLDTGRAKCKWM
jgi:hypothetical protein